MIFTVIVLNKAGGLIYQKTLNKGLNQLSINDYLVLASTFQSIHAISAKISPVTDSSGLQELESDSFKLHCLETLTGLKFLVITDPNHQGTQEFMRKLYELYSDYVMKNPFYTIDMPIKCELFETNLINSCKY